MSNSIIGSALPKSVGGIGVSVNGTAAYVQYINATQINILLPINTAPGIADLDLITPTGVMSTTLEIDAVAPGFFATH